MRRFITILTISILTFSFSQAQNTLSSDAPLDTGDIQEQYDHIMRKSSTYEGFKVIKISRFEKFKENIQDSLVTAYEKRDASLLELKGQKEQTQDLKKQVSDLQTQLAKTEKEKDSLSFLGILISKGAYMGMMWGLVFVLLFFAVFAYLLFKRSNSVTKSTKKELDDVKEEYEQHRKRALKREQELAVKYHSEINKLKQRMP